MKQENLHQNAINTQELSSVCKVFYEEITASTNQDAINATKNKEQHLSCFIAEEQTAGRGRCKRNWQTFPHKSIACSIIVREGGSDMLPLITSLIIVDSIFNVTGVKLDIKWPNDIQINGKKLAGILVESFKQAGKNIYIVGIGININKVENNINHTSGVNLTTLEDITSKSWDRTTILKEIIQNLEKALKLYSNKGWAGFKNDYNKKCITIGMKVVWQNGDTEISGIAKSMADDGTLILSSQNGEYSIRSGEIIAQGNIK